MKFKLNADRKEHTVLGWDLIEVLSIQLSYVEDIIIEREVRLYQHYVWLCLADGRFVSLDQDEMELEIGDDIYRYTKD